MNIPFLYRDRAMKGLSIPVPGCEAYVGIPMTDCVCSTMTPHRCGRCGGYFCDKHIAGHVEGQQCEDRHLWFSEQQRARRECGMPPLPEPKTESDQ